MATTPGLPSSLASTKGFVIVYVRSLVTFCVSHLETDPSWCCSKVRAIDSMGLRFFGQLLNDITDVKVMVILVGHDTLPRSIEEVEGTDKLLPPRRPQST